MITLIDMERKLDKIQHPLMILKTLNKLEIKETASIWQKVFT